MFHKKTTENSSSSGCGCSFRALWSGCGAGAKTSSRERLMEAAQRLFFRRGVVGVSVDDICKAAEVQKGSFYHFFETKEALLLDVMERDFADWKKDLEHVFNPLFPPLERVARFVHLVVLDQQEMARANGMVIGVPYATLGCETAPEDNRVCHKANEMAEAIESYYCQTLDDAKKEGFVSASADTASMARQLSGCVVGLLTYARIRNDMSHLQPDLESLMSQFFGGALLPAVHPVSHQE